MRKKLIFVWLLCLAFTPILLVAMLCHAVFGVPNRALSMAIAIDGCGNALFGGDPTMTVSERTGRGLLEGARWAKAVAPIIDFVFGDGHCISQIGNKNG